MGQPPVDSGRKSIDLDWVDDPGIGGGLGETTPVLAHRVCGPWRRGDRDHAHTRRRLGADSTTAVNTNASMISPAAAAADNVGNAAAVGEISDRWREQEERGMGVMVLSG